MKIDPGDLLCGAGVVVAGAGLWLIDPPLVAVFVGVLLLVIGAVRAK